MYKKIITAVIFFSLTAIAFALQGPQAEPASAKVLSHSDAGTVVEFTFEGIYTKTGDDGEILYSTDGKIFGDSPSMTKLIAIPAFKKVRAELVDSEWIQIPAESNLPVPEKIVTVGKPGVMRDMRLVPLTITPIRSDGKGGLEMAAYAKVILHYEGYSSENNKVYRGSTSQAFSELYKETVLNYDFLDNGPDVVGKGTYLLFIPQIYTVNNVYLPEFVNWKRMKGYQVVVDTIPNTGMTYNQIKTVIHDYYQNANPPLEYVLLVGDVNGGPVSIPATTYPHPTSGEWDVTDHAYSLLDESDDYFSDILIGRLSVINSSQAALVFHKIVQYEKNPYMGQSEWYLKMLSVGGNYNDSGPAPITPCQTARWIADFFLDHGYTDADTVLYWGPSDPNPGTPQEILGFINNGVSFVTYRGWADANGWQWPYFNITHLSSLNNNWKLPVVASFVCNTGDYGSPVNPCFGEAWIRFGSVNNGGGAVAFYGASDLHTNTNYNNALSSGWVEGIFEFGMHKMGTAMTFSKMTLYEAYPNHRETYVPFYFHVYNCLADPEMDMWTNIPKPLSLQCASTIPAGSASLDVFVNSTQWDIENAYVTVMSGSTLLAGDYTDSEGHVTLNFEPQLEGSLTVCATKYGYDPPTADISVIESQYVGYAADSLMNESNPDGSLNPGETATLRVKVKNYGSASATGCSAVLTTDYPYSLSITPASVSLGTIAAGAQSNADYNLTLDANAPKNSCVQFTLTVQTGAGTYTSKFALYVDGDNLVIASVTPLNLTPGQITNLQITLQNTGGFAASGVAAVLHSFDSAVEIIDGTASYGNIAPGQILVNPDVLSIRASADAYTGRNLQMRLNLTPTVGGVQTLVFNLTVGNPDSTDPGGPDPYGYYVYDNGDIGYAAHPTYNWVELDPAYGGSPGATRTYMGDDSSTYVQLPFDFVFYGDTYDELMICTNGWVAFDSTWMADFRNWDLPSPLGPPAMVCGFWDDLKDTVDNALDIFYKYDAANGRFIVEWSRVHNRYLGVSNRLETFEIILLDPAVHPTATGDGDIIVQLKEINDVDDDNNYSTVGIQDYFHHNGLEYVFSLNYDVHPTSAVLHNEMAIKFTTTPPDNYTGVEDAPAVVPAKYALASVYPNPFNNSASIKYEIAEPGFTTLKVFDVNGRQIKTLFSGIGTPGAYSAVWEGNDDGGKAVSSGVYFVRLESGNFEQTLKCVLMK